VTASYDLKYDPNEVGADMVVECWISQGPRAGDAAFDPQAGDWIRAGDDELQPRDARVVRRDADRVSIQMDVARRNHAVA
jgi:hypothetical protein